MKTLTEHERRTVYWGAIGIVAYLALFLGWRGWTFLESQRSSYGILVQEALRIKREFQPYENKVLLIEKLKGTFQLDLGKLSKATVVADASAAIQKAAMTGGVQLGPIRETPARASAKELASMQLECSGQVAAVMKLLQRLDSLGYPLVVDSVQLAPDATKPGMIKMSLGIVIWDFERWKK